MWRSPRRSAIRGVGRNAGQGRSAGRARSPPARAPPDSPRNTAGTVPGRPWAERRRRVRKRRRCALLRPLAVPAPPSPGGRPWPSPSGTNLSGWRRRLASGRTRRDRRPDRVPDGSACGVRSGRGRLDEKAWGHGCPRAGGMGHDAGQGEPESLGQDRLRKLNRMRVQRLAPVLPAMALRQPPGLLPAPPPLPPGGGHGAPARPPAPGGSRRRGSRASPRPTRRNPTPRTRLGC